MNTKVSGGGARFGCFTYGCGFALILSVGLFGGLGYYYVMSLRAAFEEYSAEQPPTLPPITVDGEVCDTAISKIASIRDAIATRTSTKRIFSEAELNGLISKSSAKDAVRVSLAGDEVLAHFSFTPSLFGDWRAAKLVLGSSYNRFFNGTCKAKVSVNNGVANVDFGELTLNSHTLEDMARRHASQWVSGAINSRSDGVQDNPYLNAISSLIIKDGTVEVSVGAR
jgi:hypothetical protein